jgi:hypothetical protein
LCIAFFHGRELGIEKLRARGIKSMEVSVSEAHNQTATFRSAIPKDEEEFQKLTEVKLHYTVKPCSEK